MARRARGRSQKHARGRETHNDRFAVFGTALLLRGLYLGSIHDTAFFTQLQTEPLHYFEWAKAIVAGAGAPAPPFEQAPGYPYFVAAIVALSGSSVLAIAVVQAILGALTCALLALVGERTFGRRAGLIAGLLGAAYGPWIYFTAEVVPSTLLLFLIVAALAASSPMATSGRTSSRRKSTPLVAAAWVLPSALWGLALFVRSEVVLGFPFVLLDAWKRGGRPILLRTTAATVLFLAAIVALNSPSGLVLFSTSGGVNLWLGNNPHADGVNPFVSGPLKQVEELVRSRSATAVDADRLFRQRAIDFWMQHPVAAAWLLWKKWLWTWTDRELPNTSDIEWQLGQSWLFRLPYLPLRFGVVSPLAAAGAMLIGAGWRRLPLLLAPPVIAIGTSLLFFTNARFRLPMTPTLLVLAAYTLTQLGAVRTLPLRRLLPALGAAALALGAAWNNSYGVRSYRIPQLRVNAGIVERQAGNFAAAVDLLRDGLRDDPRDEIGWIHLALALEQNGNVNEALHAYLSALSLADSADTRAMTDRFFRRHGLDPAFIEAYVNAPSETIRTDIAARAAAQLVGP
jgi:hypothetical protein